MWSDGAVARVNALKSEPAGDSVLTGSIRLTHTLIAANVVNEYRLPVHPPGQGRGRQLLPDGHTVANLRPRVPVKNSSSGVTLLRYPAISLFVLLVTREYAPLC